MDKYLKHPDPKILTKDFVESDQWDIIELKVQVDPEQLAEYYNVLNTDLAQFSFNFRNKEYLRPEIYQQFINTNRVVNYIGNIDGWTISWPIDRDIPCPGKYQGIPEIYPEVKDITHEEFYYTAKPQEKYKFGILNKLIENLSIRALRQMLVARHPIGLVTLTHVDSDLKKLHIPMISNPGAIFHFGDKGERTYIMEVGKVYVINPSVPHGTYNSGDTERVHLISRIDIDFISEISALDIFVK